MQNYLMNVKFVVKPFVWSWELVTLYDLFDF
jgi:hypothetical protein